MKQCDIEVKGMSVMTYLFATLKSGNGGIYAGCSLGMPAAFHHLCRCQKEKNTGLPYGGLFLERREMLDRIGGLGISLLVFFIILFAAPGSFGGGDVKLSAANGLYLGARLWIRSFVAAVLLAGIFIVACTLFKRERWKEEIAFGPYLCLGAAFAKWL